MEHFVLPGGTKTVERRRERARAEREVQP